MQRKPVPALLPGFQQLAAPFPIKPALSPDRQHLAIQRHLARNCNIHQAEIHRAFATGGFGAEALLPVSDGRALNVESQIIAPTLT